MPANKGGGAYFYSRNAHVCALPDKVQLPDALLKGSLAAGCTAAVKLLEVTDSTIYFARDDDRGTDDHGLRAPDVKEDHRTAAEIWSDGRFFPNVYAIPRSNVSVIQFEQDTGSSETQSLARK